MKKLNQTMRNIKRKLIYLAAAMSPLLLTGNAFASNSISGGAITDAAKQASDGISNESTSVLPYVLIIVLVVAGLSLILLGRRGKESVKELAPQVLLGIALIIFAAPIGLWMIGIFG